mgnify:CR=1 FL=1
MGVAFIKMGQKALFLFSIFFRVYFSIFLPKFS